MRRQAHYSEASIYKHLIKPVDRDPSDNKKKNPGRPLILTDRDRKRILLQIPKLRKQNEGDFTVRDIRKGADECEDKSANTVNRVLWCDGYSLRNKRRKGVLTDVDLHKRL